MGSTPNLNPPVSSAAVHAAIFRAEAPRRGENLDPERGSQRVKCVPTRAEAEFRGTFDRRLALERTPEPGERIGLMVEDRKAVEGSTAAGSEGHAQEWRHAMAEKFFWQRGADREKTVSGELIEQGHDEEGDRAEAEHLAHQPTGAGVSQRERDWAWCLEALRRGLDPAIVRARLEEGRAEDQPNPEDYARRTVEGAAASLRREIPAPEIER